MAAKPVFSDRADPSGFAAIRHVSSVDLRRALEAQRATRFQVICAGQALLSLEEPGQTVRPVLTYGGALEAAVALARLGLRVGLAATVANDGCGRAIVDRAADAGVDVGGVVLEARPASLVVAENGWIVPYRLEDDLPVTVPDAWTTELLLISGLSPALVPAASLCREARAARRARALVVVDVNARRHLWLGHDPRMMHAVLREADVVRCSTADLVSLWMDTATLRAAMRPTATIVLTNGPGAAIASGPFGEVVVHPKAKLRDVAPHAGDAFAAALCASLLRSSDIGRGEVWERALREGHLAAARAR